MSKVLLVEPYYSGSHKSWADQLISYAQSNIDLISLKGKFWKWRMHGAAISLANQINNEYDLFLVSDMIDLPLFKSLLSKDKSNKPIALYMHENQLAYPWTDKKKDWDRSYAWKNYTSALVADRICFNSEYNKTSFLSALPKFLAAFPDHQNLDTIDVIEKKSQVLPLGLELKKLDRFSHTSKNEKPIILWNHRWEHDKNPELFFQSLFQLKREGLKFNLSVLGESYVEQPEIFNLARTKLSEEIIHWGYVESRDKYLKLLWMADLLPVTSKHDFFGLSVLEAVYCHTIPLLPKSLAYPEHFSNKNVFYSSENEFYDKIKSMILNRDSFDLSLQESVKQYDWNRVVLQYDDLISRLCK